MRGVYKKPRIARDETCHRKKDDVMIKKEIQNWDFCVAFRAYEAKTANWGLLLLLDG